MILAQQLVLDLASAKIISGLFPIIQIVGTALFRLEVIQIIEAYFVRPEDLKSRFNPSAISFLDLFMTMMFR